MKQCLQCDTQYQNDSSKFCSKSCQGKYARKHRKDNRHTKYNDPKYRQKLRESKAKRDEEKLGKLIIEDRECRNSDCSNMFHIEYRERSKGDVRDKIYCSRKCAMIILGPLNGIKSAEKTRRTLQKLAANDPNHGFKDKAKQQYASDKALKSLNSRNSSKGERAIREVLKLSDLAWKAHRPVENKAVDLKNDKLKIVVEYDGPTHFRDIFGLEKLKIQQEKDIRVNIWCKDNSWKLYRISEHYFISMFERDPQKVVDDIDNFLKSVENVRKRYTGQEKSY